MGTSNITKTQKLIDEFGNQAQMLGDNVFQGSPVVIDADHHEIHCGDSFVATRAVDLSNGATDTLIITVPNEQGTPGVDQKTYHTVVNVITESEADLEIYEGATTVSDGTTVSNINRDRNSILTTGLVVTHTPSSPSGGTLIYKSHWGSGRGTGGDVRGQHEFILKNNTKYRLVLLNATANNNYISWEINHYIHPGI